MNSSAITNSIMPTVSVPGATASESKGLGFGDLMASITDNWSERNSQVKYDAAKSAQSKWDRDRADLTDKHTARDDRDNDYAARDHRDDEPRRADHEDHARVDEPKSEDHHDVNAQNRDDESIGDDTHGADRDGQSEHNDAQADTSDENAPNSNNQQTASNDQNDNNQNGVTSTEAGMVDPNQPTQAVPVPGSPEAIALANAKGTSGQVAANSAQNATGVNAPAQNAGASAADDLMNSTALSQPVAASSAKMAMNGADGTTDAMSADKFLSRTVEGMSGDAKAEGSTTAANTTNGQSANSNAL